MLSFTSSLSPHSDAFVIFVTEKYAYKDKRHILSSNAVQKINSFLSVLKTKHKDDEISSFDISDRQKCFIIKVKSKYTSYWPQENGGNFFSYIKKFKGIKKRVRAQDQAVPDQPGSRVPAAGRGNPQPGLRLSGNERGVWR